MRKYAKFIWICLLIVALQVGSISAVLVTYAADPGNDVTSKLGNQFIQGVDIKEKNGQIPGNTLVGQPDVDKTTDFYLYYEFKVPNDAGVSIGDYIILDVPKEIALPPVSAPLKFTTLVTTSNVVIADAFLDVGNTIKLVFTSSVDSLSNVGGAFYIAGNFDQNEIKTDGTDTKIQFGIPNKQVVIEVKADPIPEPDPVTMQKDGSLQAGTNIEWSITVNKENVQVNNAVVVDAIPTSQELVEATILVNGVAVATENISYENGTLRLTLGDITAEQKITFVTSLKNDALLATLEEGETSIVVTNNAKLEHDDNETTNADSPKTVTIPLNILSKSGAYNPATTVNNTKNITWTVVVNSDELAFNDAVITDLLPTGLTFVPGSESITGASGVTSSVNGSELTFNLGNITDQVTITYVTEIDPAKFQGNTQTNFNNGATLTWEGLTGSGVTKDATVGVGSSLFVKSGAGYNRSNGVISWTMSINNENINLAAPTIADIIPETHKYIEGSAKIVDHQGNVYSGGSFNYDAGTSKLSYTFGSAINSKYTITFDTKPASTNSITANTNGSFSNTAKFTSGTISFDSTGTQTYTSNVFKKQQAGYNLSTRTITWKFIVNENGATTPNSNSGALDPTLYNAISLANVSIKDAIPAGLTFIPGSVKVYDVNNNPVSNLVTTSGTDDVIFSFTNNITSQYTITFDTKITDLSKFVSQDEVLNNGNFSIKNEATLKHDETNKENTSNATQEIQNHIVSKKGAPTAYGDKFVDWVVYLNSNNVDLNALLDLDKFWLVDNLQAGLELDTTSVKLIAYDKAIVVPNSVRANGEDDLGAGRDIPLNGDHIKYDATTREFRFNFPGDKITTAYKLSYRTYVTEDVSDKTSFTNNISLFGSKAGKPVNIENAYQSGDSKMVTFLESGSMGYGNLGVFEIKKVDLEDSTKELPGATFALYDRFGNKVQEETTTADGKLEFNRIKYDLPYYIKEVVAPEGYLISGSASVDGANATFTGTGAGVVVENAIEVELDSAATNPDNSKKKNIKLSFSNQEIKAKLIEFEKQNEESKPLQGAQFGLYLRGTTEEIQTSTSNAQGIVSFDNVAYGQYDIREITAPEGYRTLTGVVHAVEVTAADHGKILPLSKVPNELILANVEFDKVDASGEGLALAEFKLVNSKDSNLVYEATSDANGKVQFEDVKAGQYTLQEIKAPFGYMPINGVIETITITEAEHGTTITLADVTNELIQSTIEFVKNNEKGQPLAKATFGLYDGQNKLVQSKESQADGRVIFTDVGEGNYTVKEIAAPFGYLLKDGVVHNVSVTANDHHQTRTLNPVSNTLIEANIEFVKVNEKGDPIEGAVFDLLDQNEDVVKTATSSAGGKVTFVDVGEGEYIIREKTPPTGYNPLTSDVATVVIDAQNHNTTVTLSDVTNEIIKGDIEFVKVDKLTAVVLKNARFALYAADDTKFDREIATASSDANGVVRFEDVEYGDYTIVEVASPVGYYLSKEKLSVSITEEGKTYQLGNFGNVKMPVEIIEGTIEINKVNTLGDSLSGAKFGLYNVMGRLVAEAVTNSSGIARFTSVPEGVYTVEELEAPKNFVKSDEVQNATISSEINDVKLKFVNERSSDAPWPGVSVQKVDDQGSPLAGVTFTLYKATDVSFTTPVASSTTNASGVATFSNVVPGKYVVKETQSLEGYILSDVTLSVTVVDDGKTYNAGTVENRVIRNDVVVNKVNEDDKPLQGAEFALYDKNGKLFKTVVSNKNGVAEFKDIPYGSYTLKEKTAPKSYEKSDEVVAIQITEDGKVQTVTFVNKKVTLAGVDSNNSDEESTNSNESGSGNTNSGIESSNGNNGGTAGGDGNGVEGYHQDNELPKTGDSIATMIWLFIGSGLLIAALLLVSRRKAQKQ